MFDARVLRAGEHLVVHRENSIDVAKLRKKACKDQRILEN
jgi:hypothetical protein